MEQLFKVWCHSVNEWELHKIFIDGMGILWHDAPHRLIRLKQNTHTIVWNTGIKDMDGTDVYEGDIVRWGASTYMHVIFVNGAFLQTDDGMSPDMWYDWDEVVVVGNIYENDDLLTKAI